MTTLYVMQAKLCREEANVVVDSTGELWDKRLGHISETGLQMLAKKDILLEVKYISLKHCVECLARKQNKASFHSRPLMRRRHALELVHTDVCYMDAKPHHGAQYFVTFIDDYNN